ncbi:MAG: polysaccharide deacetylase family protein [Bacteroidia bacterium]|nr:polysaccharide deacetylase family protein [Bacteroidia bacterium]
MKTIVKSTLMIMTSALFVSCGNNARQTANTEPQEPEKLIALSFDDGPNLVTTPKVLDVLEENGIKASFFLIGQNINDESAQMIEREKALGCDIENHSFTHSYMSAFTEEQIKDEIAKTTALIKHYAGEEPKFFRPPYINHNDLMHQAIGLTFICGLGCNDWEADVTAEQRAASVIANAADGQIVLLHDFEGNDNTVEALKTIIPELKAQGFKFVTVPELFEAKGIALEPNNGKIYTNVLTD